MSALQMVDGRLADAYSEDDDDTRRIFYVPCIGCWGSCVDKDGRKCELCEGLGEQVYDADSVFPEEVEGEEVDDA